MRTIAHGSEIHRAQRELTHRDSGTAENSALHKEWSFPRNAVLRGPRRLQFGGGHLQLRPALRILIGTDHVANLERRNAVPGGSPAALGDLDEQTVDAYQVRRSNPHATQHDRRAILATSVTGSTSWVITASMSSGANCSFCRAVSTFS